MPRMQSVQHKDKDGNWKDVKMKKYDVHIPPVPGGILGALTITFVILKALGHLDWWWGWVFAPLWIPVATIIVIVVLKIGIDEWKSESWWIK